MEFCASPLYPAFFFKQWGEFNDKGERVGKKKAGRELNGRVWSEFPAELES